MRLSERDLGALRWLTDMRAAYESDVAVLLGRMSGRGPVSASAARQTVDRWRKGGLARGQKLLVQQPRIVFLQAAGAQLVGEHTWKDAAVWSSVHAAEVSRARLWLETPGVHVPSLPGLVVADWTPERRFRQDLMARYGNKMPAGVHVPDGIVQTGGGKRIAVEVERTPKEARRLDRIMEGLLVPGGWDAVLYLVSTPTIGRAVAAAAERARSRGLSVPLLVEPLPTPEAVR